MQTKVDDKWNYRKYSALSGETIGEYSRGDSLIEAKSAEVLCRNIVITSTQDLEDFAQALSKAWETHRKMRAQVLESLMGRV
jgi:predicted nucleic acid-binding Zn ribbon protein